jgi:ParB/RepB/Spo0J family partition protein
MNPRKTFDQAAIDELAASIKNVGLLQPLVVRRNPRPPNPILAYHSPYELIIGERRYRAAKQAKLTTVPCRVVELTDEEVREAVLEENLKRKDLNPIEEAIGFKQILDAGDLTQDALAKRFRLTQGHISNRIRLLELPEEWQQRIISGEITPTDARDLVRWAKFPAVLDVVGRELKQYKRFPSEWQLRACIEEASKPLSGYYYDRTLKRDTGVGLSKKDAEREDLQVVEVKGLGKRAFNVALWEELHQAGLARRQQQESAKVDRAGSNGNGTAPKLTAAEKRRKAQQQAEQWRNRLYGWKVLWLQERIAEKLAGCKDAALVLKLVLSFACQDQPTRRLGDLCDAVKELGGKRATSRRKYSSASDAWCTLSTRPTTDALEIARLVLLRWVKHPPEPAYRTDMPSEDVEAIAAELGIDVAKDWTLDRSFLELHTKDQLAALAKEWGCGHIVTRAHMGAKRAALIDALLTDAAAAKCPKELLKVKANGQ